MTFPLINLLQFFADSSYRSEDEVVIYLYVPEEELAEFETQEMALIVPGNEKKKITYCSFQCKICYNIFKKYILLIMIYFKIGIFNKFYLIV